MNIFINKLKPIKSLIYASIIGVLFAPTASFANVEKSSYVLGVFPHLPPRELEKVFSPMAVEFSHVLGKKIKLRSSSTYKKFMVSLDNNEYDIVFVQPFDYVRVAEELNLKPIATRAEQLTAILVIKDTSAIKNIMELKGRTIALPPLVAAVSQLTFNLLKKHNITPGIDVKITHHRSHVSCMQQVLIGNASACGTAAPALRFFKHKMNTNMKIIAESIAIPHTLFVSSKNISEKEHKSLVDLVTNWDKTESGKIILKRGKMKPFIPISDKDYDVVRNIKLIK